MRPFLAMSEHEHLAAAGETDLGVPQDPAATRQRTYFCVFLGFALVAGAAGLWVGLAAGPG